MSSFRTPGCTIVQNVVIVTKVSFDEDGEDWVGFRAEWLNLTTGKQRAVVWTEEVQIGIAQIDWQSSDDAAFGAATRIQLVVSPNGRKASQGDARSLWGAEVDAVISTSCADQRLTTLRTAVKTAIWGDHTQLPWVRVGQANKNPTISRLVVIAPHYYMAEMPETEPVARAVQIACQMDSVQAVVNRRKAKRQAIVATQAQMFRAGAFCVEDEDDATAMHL